EPDRRKAPVACSQEAPFVSMTSHEVHDGERNDAAKSPSAVAWKYGHPAKLGQVGPFVVALHASGRHRGAVVPKKMEALPQDALRSGESPLRPLDVPAAEFAVFIQQLDPQRLVSVSVGADLCARGQ